MIDPTLNSGIPKPIHNRVPSYNILQYAEIGRLPFAGAPRTISVSKRGPAVCPGTVFRYLCGHLSLANVLPGLTVVAAKA